MMEPYQYVITYHPHLDDFQNSPRILHHGILMACSQRDAFTKMVKVVTPEEALEADLIEFRVKPFIDEKSCPTKKDIGGTVSYGYCMNDNVYEFRNTTVSLEDMLKGSFMNYMNNLPVPELPKVMTMIDVLGLINDDKL